MQHRQSFLTAWICVLMAAVGARPSLAQEIYTALRTDPFMTALGLSVDRKSFGGRAIGYTARNADNSILHSIGIAVYPTIDQARNLFAERLRRPASSPMPPPPGDPLGDEFAWWVSPSPFEEPHARLRVAHATVRWRNVVMTLSCYDMRIFGQPTDDRRRLSLTPRIDSPQETLHLLRRVDEILRNNRRIAPLGTFDPPPDIVDPGFPSSLTIRPMTPYTPDGKPALSRTGRPLWPSGHPESYVRINPQFRGLGPVENIRFKLTIKDVGMNQAPDGKSPEWLTVPDGPERTRRVRASAENDGRFILELRVPEQPITTTATLIAFNEDNVIVTKEIEVTITPQN